MIRNLRIIKTLCGEGDFYIYDLLKRRRFFLCMKLFLFLKKYSFCNEGSNEELVFAVGVNQNRLYGRLEGKIKKYYENSIKINSNTFAFKDAFIKGFGFFKFILMAYYIILIFFTGSKKYLNFFVLSFYNEIYTSLSLRGKSVKVFVCFNDQPLDVAAIILALREIGSSKTIVIQHGLILNEKFYFPSNAHEFWAWGDISREFYKSRFKDSKLIVRGRYDSDQLNFNNNWFFKNNSAIKVLLAPSFFYKEIFDIFNLIYNNGLFERDDIYFAIKMHPSTKFKLIIRALIWIFPYKISEEHDEMERLSLKYDCLFTKNSTSSLDFLLIGKPVFFIETNSFRYPCSAYGFVVNDLIDLLEGVDVLNGKNSGRLRFLQEVINVEA